MLATICAFSSVAASSTRYAEMSNGYTVSSTASYSGNTTSGKGSVTNGWSCSIKVWVYGYYKSGSYVKLSCNSYNSVDNNKSLTVTANGYYTLVGSKYFSQFNSATTVSATVGKTA